MRRYLLRKVVAFAATLLFVSILAFTVVRVLPGDPALLIMGTEGNPAATARLRAALGLDRPLPVQYVEWLARAVRGDLGLSIQYDVPVGRLILSPSPSPCWPPCSCWPSPCRSVCTRPRTTAAWATTPR